MSKFVTYKLHVKIVQQFNTTELSIGYYLNEYWNFVQGMKTLALRVKIV